MSAPANLSALFGSMVFNEDTMLQRLSPASYQAWKKCITDDTSLDLSIANEIADYMEDHDDELFVIGSGTTPRAVMEVLELPNTLLGVDVVDDFEVIAADVNEPQLYELVKGRKTKIVITVIGGQGHILGRGNQQLTPEVLRRIGKENIIILATKEKIMKLRGQPLLVDTGDAELDQYLSGYHHAICDYNETIICKVCPG